METNELINYLSIKYSIEESKLNEIIRFESPPLDIRDLLITISPSSHIIKVSLKDKELEFNSLDELEKKFPKIILFVFPIYGAFEYGGDNLDIQNALKKFVLEFGKFVRNEVVVFDYWSQDEFDYEQYNIQKKEVMDIFNISSDDCPCILVSNKSPHSWNKSYNDKKAILIILKNLKSSEIGPKLRKLAGNLENLKFPSSWGNKWDRFIKWFKENDIIVRVLGSLL